MAESFTAQLIRRFQIEQKKNDHSGVYALSQKLLAYHSNRIEGGMLTEKQTASLFDTDKQERTVGRSKVVRKFLYRNFLPPEVQKG